MLKANLTANVEKMKRGNPGLPRRQVCVRAVHHIFRWNWETLGNGEGEDESPPSNY